MVRLRIILSIFLISCFIGCTTTDTNQQSDDSYAPETDVFNFKIIEVEYE